MLSIVLFVAYLVSLVANTFVSLKYPDGTITVVMLLLSTILLVIDILWIRKAFNSKWGKGLKIFALCGMMTGPVVWLIGTFDFLEIVSAVQYPLYIVFITPFFGLNLLLDVSYQVFSLIVSVYYLIIVLYLYIKK